MEAYQAKDIMRILQIPRHRFDYSLLRLDIEPDIEKAGRRGQTSRFSFSALLDFAIATTAFDLGFNPDFINFALKTIHQHDDEERWGLFDPSTDKNISFHHGLKNKSVFYFFSGDVRSLLQKPWCLDVRDPETGESLNLPKDFNPEKVSTKKLIKISNTVHNLTRDVAANDLDVCQTFNISGIKKRVLERI